MEETILKSMEEIGLAFANGAGGRRPDTFRVVSGLDFMLSQGTGSRVSSPSGRTTVTVQTEHPSPVLEAEV